MTDNEIIKAFEHLVKNANNHIPITGKMLLEDVLDVLNRQKAEIERLHKLQKPTETSGFKIENGKVVFYTNMLNGYRHEYKDLEEVVKELNLLLQNSYKADDVVMHYKAKSKCARIDNLAKEMVGDDNA